MKKAAETTNGVAEQKPKKNPRPTDPTLLVARKLDNLLAALKPAVRAWALGWLAAKYSPEQPDTPADVVAGT